ncbi:MAG: hypothetical protein MUD08_01505 [Cytophagales bacterium]|jgi:hypothetical protein|nr:hypothetical protein [Cytophagales bacterium]
MNSLKLILFFALAGVWTAHAQENILYPALKETIDSLAAIDQKVQQDFINGSPENRPALEKTKDETFVRHAGVLKEILKKYGYPNFDKVGKKASANYWLCVQHCDHDLAFQKEVLKEMKREVKNKKAGASHFAYLVD